MVKLGGFCFFFFFSQMLTLLLSAQCVIQGDLINYKGDSIISISKPINGFASNAFLPDSSRGKIINGRFKIKIECNRPVFIGVSFSGKVVYLITRPHDSIYLKLTFPVLSPNSRVQCVFGGSNAQAHRLFYDYQYVPISKYERLWKIIKETGPEDIVPAIRGEIDRQVDPFDSLCRINLLSADCFSLIRSTISSFLLGEAVSKISNVKTTNIRISDSLRGTIAASLFKIFPPLDENNLYGLSTFLYIDTYLAFVRSQRLNTGSIFSQPDTSISYNGKTYNITGPFVPLLEVGDRGLREYFYARMILSCLSAGAASSLRDELAFMYDYYHDGTYLPVINEYYLKDMKRRTHNGNRVLSFYKGISPNIIDSSGDIPDLNLDRVAALRDKIIFVDIWATWCAPCLQEMTYNYELDSLLYANGIEHLYISIDNKSEIERWLSTIRESHLGGYHILAGNKLKKFILNVLEDGRDYIAIPRYLIIRNSDILISDAFRPSDFDRLKMQIHKIVHS